MAKNQNENMLREDINTYLDLKYRFLSIKGNLFPRLLDICRRLHAGVSNLASVTDIEFPCGYDNGDGEVSVVIDEGGPFPYFLSFPIKYLDMSSKEIDKDIERFKKEEKRKVSEQLFQHEKEEYIRLRKKFGRKRTSRRKHDNQRKYDKA